MADRFLSIVTVSLNQSDYLRQCVESVLSQKGSDVEYIVVDPGSTDGSREILASYGDAIDHLVLEPDDGPAHGLNKGFALARGRYGYFLNSDDFLLPGAVGHLRALWQRSEETADALLCGAWLVDGGGRPIREARPTPVDLPSLLSGRAAIVQHGFSFRMSSFRDVGGFNGINRTCWDYELMCALAAHRVRFVVARERIGVFRLHEAGLSGGLAGAAHLARYDADLRRIHETYAGRPPTRVDSLCHTAGRWLKHFDRPVDTIALLADRLAPERLARRWRSDFGAAHTLSLDR